MIAPENPAAFPRTLDADEVQFDKAQVGMTLRDWFAGQALNGIMAAEADDVVYDEANVAFRAYRFADAMLSARSRKARS